MLKAIVKGSLANPGLDIGLGAGESPIETLTGLQFQLLSQEELKAHSVFHNEPITKLAQLTDPRLGLPAVGERCLTCRATEFPDCPGHFGHIQLAHPVYHPSFVRTLHRILKQACLACGRHLADERKKKKQEQQQQQHKKKNKPKSSSSGGNNKDKAPAEPEPTMLLPPSTTVVKRPPVPAVVGSDVPSSSRSKPGKRKLESAVSISGPYFRPRKKRSDKAEYVNLSSGSDAEDEEEDGGGDRNRQLALMPPPPPSPLTAIPIRVMPKAMVRKSPDQQQQDEGAHKKVYSGRKCKYCQPPANKDEDPYPKIILKVHVKDFGDGPIKDKIEVLMMKASLKAGEELPVDFWDFLGEVEDEECDEAAACKPSRVLLPSSALRVMKKLGMEVRKKLKCLGFLEGTILQCLPVPPNCTRVVDDNLFETSEEATLGVDKKTLMLRRIWLTNRRPKVKFDQLQRWIGQYFRLGGAGKVAKAVEPQIGRNKETEQSLKTKFRKKMKDCVVGKVSNNCARAILTGDPTMDIGEIGIPDEIASRVTVSERVSRFNIARFQKVCEEVGDGKNGNLTSKGMSYYERNGEVVYLGARNVRWEPEMGDIVFGCLRDGDMVFANRNPSLHKHSLIGLKVRRHSAHTVMLNPLLCKPLNADFDGDSLHVFAPQSLEAVGELKELMTVPQQMICPQGGQVMIHLTQDALLGAHLLTSSGVFIRRQDMDHMAFQAFGTIPKPAIVKCGKDGAPCWTGAQLFELSLPADLDYHHTDAVLISKGHLLRCKQGSDWLTNTTHGLLPHICRTLGPDAALRHLHLAQSIIQRWLEIRGFSFGLDDVYVSSSCPDFTSRIKQEWRMRKQRVLEHPLVSAHLRPRVADHTEYMDLDGDDELLEEAEKIVMHSKNKSREAIGITEFRAMAASVQQLIASKMAPGNSFLTMVQAGTKGSMGKLVQQCGTLGLQLGKGAKLQPPNIHNSVRRRITMSPEDEAWAGCGVVESSFLDGLDPYEFFTHALSSRISAISQSLDVKFPGSLFKNLMCFLRDIYVAFDGTVRNRYNQQIVQFMCGAALALHGEEAALDMNDCAKKEVSQDAAGEPVGALAATAVVQPIYQAILDSPHQIGIKDVLPLELLLETLLPSFTSVAKPNDRRVILRLRKPSMCHCNVEAHGGCICREKVALKVKKHLTHVSLRKLTKSTAIHYDPREGDSVVSPWTGHIHLSGKELQDQNLPVEDVLHRLRQLVAEQKIAKIFGKVRLDFYYACHTTNSHEDPCIHLQAEYGNQDSADAFLESLESMKHALLPALLEMAVRGSSLVQSVRIMWENRTSPTRMSSTGPEEIVLDVETKQETKGKSERGKSFDTVKMACVQILELVDWSRSAPYSIQELRDTHGIEVVRRCVLHRLTLAVKGMGIPVHFHHLQLITDTMTFTGKAIGFSYAGFKEFLRAIGSSAPFSQAAFQAPWQSFTESALKSQREDVAGALASCAWGKLAPVGTGADCDIRYRVKDMNQILKQDVHELYGRILAEVAEQTPIPEAPYCGEYVSSPPAADADMGAGDDEWGTSSNPTSDGWGCETTDVGKAKGEKASPQGWGNSSTSWGTDNAPTSGLHADQGTGGWGSAKENPGKQTGISDRKADDGWSAEKKTDDDWGTPEGAPASAGWGSANAHPSRQAGNSDTADDDGWGVAKKTDNDWGTSEGAPASGGWGDNGEKDLWGGPKDALQDSSDTRGNGWHGEKRDEPKEAWGRGSPSTRGRPGWRNEFTSDHRKKTSGANMAPRGRGRWRDGGNRGNDTSKAVGEDGGSKALVKENETTDAGEAGGIKGWDDQAEKPGSDGWGDDSSTGWGAKATEEFDKAESNWGIDPSNVAPAERKDFNKFSGEGKKKWDTSRSGANLIPLGQKKKFWNKGDLSSDGTEGHESMGQRKASASGQQAGGDACGDKADAEGWGQQTSGWGSDKPAGSKAEDDDDWGKETGGWSAGRKTSNEAEGTIVDWGQEKGGWELNKNTTAGGSRKNDWQKSGEGQRKQAAWGTDAGKRRPAEREAAVAQDAGMSLSPEDEAVKKEIDQLLNRLQEIVFSPAETGGNLSEEDHKFVVEQILPYHPGKQMKMSTGFVNIKVDFHPDFPTSRCLFLVHADGSTTDFSYHKCLQEMARAKSKAVFENYSSLIKTRRARPPRVPRSEQDCQKQA